MDTNFIDVHHHIIPKIYVEGLNEVGIDKSGGRPFKKWKPEDSIALMNDIGIETAICSISSPGLVPAYKVNPEKTIALARKVNEDMADMIQKYPGRFGAFALLPLPDVDAALKEIEYALDVLKLDGVGLLSNYDDDYLGNSVYNEIFEELQRRKAVAYVHPNSVPTNFVRPQFTPLDYFEEFTFCTTRAATNLILSGTMERCPDVKLFFSHMGGTFPYLRWRLTCCTAGAQSNPDYLPFTKEQKDALMSLSKPFNEYMKMYYYDCALSADPLAFEAVEMLDPEHICFGSDAFFANPWSSAFSKEGIIRRYGENRNKLYAICRGNAEKVFPRFMTMAQKVFPLDSGF